MNNYSIMFCVKGDKIAKTHIDCLEVEAETLQQLAEKTYPEFKEAMWYVWKKMESDVRLELIPNSLITINCKCNDQVVPEMDVFQEFYKIRIKHYQESRPKFTV